MARKNYIKKAIVKFVDQNSLIIPIYSNWYVGITSNPKTRLTNGHGDPEIYAYWEVDHHLDARDIEKHFLEEGMLGDTGGGWKPKYVYIYKKFGPGS
jgi:hypothetical protein